jgi:hypothetical protein
MKTIDRLAAFFPTLAAWFFLDLFIGGGIALVLMAIGPEPWLDGPSLVLGIQCVSGQA